jgi:hypothetical protein
MTRFGFLILIIISSMAGSCSNRKPKLDNKHMIPEKELVSLLTDIHIGTGLFNLQSLNAWASSLDSTTSYIKIIEKHGYTKEIMDKTMKYYFYKDPKKLNKIYDQVLGILSEMESHVEKDSNVLLARNSNLWPGKDFYSIPSLSGNDSTMFDITLSRSGYYALSFSATLFADDQSVNPRASLYSSSSDSVETGSRKYFKSIIYLKDGRPHTYKLNIPNPENKIRHLKGWLYDFDTPSYGIQKHFKIENISLIYTRIAI